MSEAIALPEEFEVVPTGPLVGELRAPPSKSVTNRLLVAAALAEGTSVLHGVLESDDTTAMAVGLGFLGADITRRRDASSPIAGATLDVTGTGGHLIEPSRPIDAGLSGTTLRFLSAVALLVPGTVTLDGAPPLRKRPIAPLLAALSSLGAVVASDHDHPPLTVTSAGLAGGPVHVDVWASSQFVTALLLVAPYARRRVEISATGLGATGYLDLTLETMERWGAGGELEHPGHYVIEGRRTYVGRDDDVEYDASAAAHLFALAMASGGSITVQNARSTLQPDARIVSVFEAMGASIVHRRPGDGGGLTVSRPGPLRGTEVDVSCMPDQVPTLGALGALASGTTRLTNASVSRGHETDRVAATATELSRLGAAVEVDGDTLTVHGGRPLHGGDVQTYDDHRMAMAFTAIASVVPGIRIRDPACVRKTYPGYWDDARGLGLKLRRPDES